MARIGYSSEMFPRGRFLCAVAFALLAGGVCCAQAGSGSAVAPLVADGLGKGAVALDGPWQFHLGDDAAWAKADVDDATGHDGWEQISPDEPWGAQGHRSYTGYAWYRRHVSITLAPGASPDLSMYLPPVEDVYEIYWNGVLVGQYGKMPPHPVWYFRQGPQTMGVGKAGAGVLAVRVWKAPLASFDSGVQGGFSAAPAIGSPAAVGGLKAVNDLQWVRSNQILFFFDGFYLLAGLIALVAWLRNRGQWLLFWGACLALTAIVPDVLQSYRLSLSWIAAAGWSQPAFGVSTVAGWYLLLLLLRLDESKTIRRIVRVLAIVEMVSYTLDAGVVFAVPFASANGLSRLGWTDAILTGVYTFLQMLPVVLVVCAVVRRRKLSVDRWLVAFFAFLAGLIPTLITALQQGSRYTHVQWLRDLLLKPLFTINGSPMDAEGVADTLLFFALVYAVYRHSEEDRAHQVAVERELMSAREMQRVLVPEVDLVTPGYVLTSSYRPASEVGGDFFVVLALEGEATLIVLGDVSGKGLKAAMAVSLIVGMVRALGAIFPAPGRLLAEINDRLAGRLQGGFATAIAVRLEPQGGCTVASAGHLSPFVNEREVELPGALPLGIVAGVEYSERRLELMEGDHLAIYTDGLLEARNGRGEMYGFERLHALFGSRPSAAEVSDVAVSFGQDDDITVLTLTRVETQDGAKAPVLLAQLRTS